MWFAFRKSKPIPNNLIRNHSKNLGYKYNSWFPAVKKGYSGVAILSKIEPKNVAFGTGIDYMDFEGRNVRADFDDFSVMSLYLPSGTNICPSRS